MFCIAIIFEKYCSTTVNWFSWRISWFMLLGLLTARQKTFWNCTIAVPANVHCWIWPDFKKRLSYFNLDYRNCIVVLFCNEHRYMYYNSLSLTVPWQNQDRWNNLSVSARGKRFQSQELFCNGATSTNMACPLLHHDTPNVIGTVMVCYYLCQWQGNNLDQREQIWPNP